MAEQQQGLIYPKSAQQYLLARINDLNVDVCNLITTLIERDQRIAALEAENAALKQAPGNVVTMVPPAAD